MLVISCNLVLINSSVEQLLGNCISDESIFVDFVSSISSIELRNLFSLSGECSGGE